MHEEQTTFEKSRTERQDREREGEAEAAGPRPPSTRVKRNQGGWTCNISPTSVQPTSPSLIPFLTMAACSRRISRYLSCKYCALSRCFLRGTVHAVSLLEVRVKESVSETASSLITIRVLVSCLIVVVG